MLLNYIKLFDFNLGCIKFIEEWIINVNIYNIRINNVNLIDFYNN